MRLLFLHILACLALATPSVALTLDECARTTHISHGGETGHGDIGDGRVRYVEWWSQEGVYTDVIVMDCETGRFLETRTQEERIAERFFDRRNEASAIFERELRAAPALFSFERLAGAMFGVGQDIVIAETATETCACAALYPQLRGDKTPYEVAE